MTQARWGVFGALFILLGQLGANARAADPLPASPPPPPPQTEYMPGFFDMITNIPGDWVSWSKDVFRAQSLPAAGVITGSTVGLMTVDRQSYDATTRTYNQGSQHAKDFLDFGETLGHGSYQIIAGGGFTAVGLIVGDRRAIRVGSEVLEGVLGSGTISQVLKHITGRQSPCCATTRTGKWQPFTNPFRYQKSIPSHDAFPSGHVTTATATATIINNNFPDAGWLPFVTYPFVGYVGYATVSKGGHWWSDYPLAIGLGYSFANTVTRRHYHYGEVVEPPKTDVSVVAPYPSSAELLFTYRI